MDTVCIDLSKAVTWEQLQQVEAACNAHIRLARPVQPVVMDQSEEGCRQQEQLLGSGRLRGGLPTADKIKVRTCMGIHCVLCWSPAVAVGLHARHPRSSSPTKWESLRAVQAVSGQGACGRGTSHVARGTSGGAWLLLKCHGWCVMLRGAGSASQSAYASMEEHKPAEGALGCRHLKQLLPAVKVQSCLRLPSCSVQPCAGWPAGSQQQRCRACYLLDGRPAAGRAAARPVPDEPALS